MSKVTMNGTCALNSCTNIMRSIDAKWERKRNTNLINPMVKMPMMISVRMLEIVTTRILLIREAKRIDRTNHTLHLAPAGRKKEITWEIRRLI